MKRNQQGFTLIELMIVVAIIAILAAIAIPLYLNYTAQAEGSEATVLSDGAKTAIVQHYNEYGSWPTNNDDAGIAPAVSISGKYVQSVTITNGVIDAWFKGSGVATPLKDKHLFLSPVPKGGSIAWDCYVASSAMYKYVPSTCRHTKG